ncbi:hypothetical protein BV20DRAFT_1039144 [Pilatotrama ljubarskyi]|nr:hypothetical protein BV20DRAFT_1039144 [Pilatotrama ljubarskyi]
MSFAAPVPRLPLASVLRHLDASWAPRTPDPCDADATRGSQRDDDLPQLGLGLVMGAACLPIQLPRPYLESELESLSPSRYSRRLRSLAPAPLQLASPTPRTPFRSLTQAQTPVPASTRRTPCSAAFVDVPLDTHCASAFGDVSISPQSERRASISSAMASISTAPTSLVFPGESENVTMGRNTNPPSYVDLLSWHRSVSRSLDSPLSPLAAKSIHTGTSSAHKAMRSPATPATPARRSSLGNENPFTPGLPPDAVPPPLRRTEWVPLPELTDEELPSSDVQLLSPLRADLRLDLGVEDLALRAESCSETIARASLSLCSCSLLREPEAIVSLIDRLRATFASVQRALDGTPADFVAGGSDAKRIWYAKHWQIIASLDRNLNLFYLLAHQIEERPPRIHRLAPLLDKLSTYQVKFADLARRITLSHEKLRFLGLRAELSLPPTPARTSIDDKERVLRYDARAARQEGRARRREIREEITRVRGRIRAIREREVDLTRNDENMTVCGDDEDIEREKWRQGWW